MSNTVDDSAIDENVKEKSDNFEEQKTQAIQLDETHSFIQEDEKKDQSRGKALTVNEHFIQAKDISDESLGLQYEGSQGKEILKDTQEILHEDAQILDEQENNEKKTTGPGKSQDVNEKNDFIIEKTITADQNIHELKENNQEIKEKFSYSEECKTIDDGEKHPDDKLAQKEPSSPDSNKEIATKDNQSSLKISEEPEDSKKDILPDENTKNEHLDIPEKVDLKHSEGEDHVSDIKPSPKLVDQSINKNILNETALELKEIHEEKAKLDADSHIEENEEKLNPVEPLLEKANSSEPFQEKVNAAESVLEKVNPTEPVLEKLQEIDQETPLPILPGDHPTFPSDLSENIPVSLNPKPRIQQDHEELKNPLSHEDSIPEVPPPAEVSKLSQYEELYNSIPIPEPKSFLIEHPEAKLALEFKYEFNQKQRLVHLETGESFKFLNQNHYEKIGKVVQKCIEKMMTNTYGLKRVEIPKDSNETSPKSYIYISPNFNDPEKQHPKALLLIQGAGAVRPGIWARSVCINDSLKTGSMNSFLSFANKHQFEVIIFNPNKCRSKNRPIPKNNSLENHGKYLWETFIRDNSPKDLYIIGHSCGGLSTVSLASLFWKEFKERVKGIAFTDAVHGYHGMDRDKLQFFKRRAVDWIASSSPLDTKVGQRDPIVFVSSGHNRHEYTTGSARKSIKKFLLQINEENPYLT